MTAPRKSALAAKAAPNDTAPISTAAAKQAALSHAGVSDAVWTKAQFDRSDGRYIYELEFIADNTEFDYEIDALSGTVIKAERESFHGSHSGGQDTSGSLIGEAAAALR